MNIKEINDELLEKVQGGSVDWQLFATKLLNAVTTSSIEINDDIKRIIQTIKTKNWIQVAIEVTPLIATNPDIQRIVFECMNN